MQDAFNEFQYIYDDYYRREKTLNDNEKMLMTEFLSYMHGKGNLLKSL